MSARTDDDRALRAADAAARLAAQQEFARPFVLEAGAGTGKTTVLVARAVAWLLGPGWERAETRLGEAAGPSPGPEDVAADALRRVVALTFTEAAAAEMASRIAEALLAVVAEKLPRGVCEEALPPAPSRQARARALVAGLDQLAVRTIHAWCRRLLAAQPLEAGLHPRFEVDADGRRTAEVVREVLERELARVWADPADPAHRALAAEGHGPADLEEALLALLDAGMPAAALAESPFTREALLGLDADLVGKLRSFLEAEAGALARVRGAAVAARTAAALAAALPLCTASVPADAGALGLRAQELGALCGSAERGRLHKWGRGVFGVREREALEPRAGEVAARAAELAPLLEHYCALDPEALERARRVLHSLLAQVEGELRRRGVESFEALLQDARRLLEERPAAAARIRGEIEQLLVDEFQDTDRTQCAILSALVLDAPAGGPRPGLFLVGDPKQSIYGWRNADLAAYDDFVDRVRRDGGRFERLSVSFRAAPPLLREVENAVGPVMREVPRRQPPFEPLVAAPERARDPGFDLGGRAPVEHWVSWPLQAPASPQTRPRARDAAELEARTVARELAALHREHAVPWNHSALLFRALSDVEVYLEALREAGVPYVVERDRSYYERREVIEAGALVRCVLDPRDQVALVAFLRSAWVGVPDAALVPLWGRKRLGLLGALRGRDPRALAAAREAVLDAAKEVPGDLPGLADIAGWEHGLVHAVEVLDALRRSHENEAPDVFVERLRALLAPEASEAARYLGLYRLANLDRFFRDLIAALEESGGDVGAVLASLRTVSVAREAAEGRPRDAASDAVHVLSVHKAKGLDFEQVFLMQLHKESGGDSPKARAAPGERGWEYKLFGWATPGFHASAREALAVDEAERVRTLYVALTRARRRLVLCGVRSEAGRRRSPDEARSHAQLIDSRFPEPADLEALFADAAAQGRFSLDSAETRWVFPALLLSSEAQKAPDGGVAKAERPPGHVDRRGNSEAVEAAEAEVEALARARTAAGARERRPFGEAASGQEPRLAVEAIVDARVAGESEAGRQPPVLRRELALAVGTALHGALEDLDPGAAGPVQRTACLDRAESLLSLLVAPDDREAATARTRELIDRFWSGPLHARLREIGPHILARELPVLLAPEEEGEGPVGFVAGAIDLLYRDPESGELVVADYKSDAVSSPSEARRKADDYRGQGERYVCAVQQALELPRPPRFELWFLAIGHVESLPSFST